MIVNSVGKFSTNMVSQPNRQNNSGVSFKAIVNPVFIQHGVLRPVIGAAAPAGKIAFAYSEIVQDLFVLLTGDDVSKFGNEIESAFKVNKCKREGVDIFNLRMRTALETGEKTLFINDAFQLVPERNNLKFFEYLGNILKNLAQDPPIRDVEPKYHTALKAHNVFVLFKFANKFDGDVIMAKKLIDTACAPAVHKDSAVAFRDEFQDFMTKTINKL